MVGSEIPKSNEIEPGIAISRTRFSLDLIINARTTPSTPNVETIATGLIGFEPCSANKTYIIGIIPQCKPKITNNCHATPRIAPNSKGLNVCKAVKATPIKSEAQEATGPITRNARGTLINTVKNGVRKERTNDGMNARILFSMREPAHTAKIVGIIAEK